MKIKSKKIILRIAIAIAILSIFVLISLLKKDLWDVNSELLREEVLSIGQDVETVNLSDLTVFEWDVAYSFDPYTSKDTIYETVGYKWDNISETVSEGMNQVVFLKAGKVVCYLYGYPKNNGYGIYFTSNNDTEVNSASVLRSENNLIFKVVRNNGVIYLNN